MVAEKFLLNRRKLREYRRNSCQKSPFFAYTICMTIIDSHTHAWQYWPYEPPVPDHESRGKVEQLLWEMDRVGVDKAVLV